MEKEFINYTEALALKELAFDEPCIAYYDSDDKFNLKLYLQYDCHIEETITDKNTSNLRDVTAPLYQQCFRWFREKYNFCYFIRGNNFDGYSYNIDNLGVLQYKFEIEYRFSFKTYEEAELECLKKLISIVKNNEK